MRAFRERTEPTLTRAQFLLLLAVLSCAFLAVFSFRTSPVAAFDPGADSAFFMLVGQGMTKGLLPYRDFFDMKGPFFFLLEYIGQRLCYGRVGIFTVQWINLCLSALLICDIYRRCGICNRLAQLCLLLPIGYVAIVTLDGGNLTEEFSLFPLLSCLDLCLAFFANSGAPEWKWQRSIYPIAGAWFGFCFGLLLMIRVTNAALLCATVLTVTVYLLRERKFGKLFLCAGIFVAGLIAAVLPFVLFYASKGLLDEMLESVLVLGLRYSGEKSFFLHIAETVCSRNKQQLLLLLVPACMPFVLRWRGWPERMLSAVGALFTFFAIASGNNYTHYYTLTLPLLVLCELPVAEALRDGKSKRRSVAVVLTVIMLLTQVPIVKTHLFTAGAHLFLPDRYTTGESVRELSERIPEEERDSVFCYELEPSWYVHAGVFPCIRYCAWQEHYIGLMPEIYDELRDIFAETPPTWLVLSAGERTLPDFMENMLNNGYRLNCRNEKFALYRYSG